MSTEDEASEGSRRPRFWTLGGIALVLTAIGGLVTALAGAGLLSGGDSDDTQAATETAAPTESPSMDAVGTVPAPKATPSESRTLVPRIGESLESDVLSIDIKDETVFPNYLFRAGVDPTSAHPAVNADGLLDDGFVEWAVTNDGRLFGKQRLVLEIRGRDEKAVGVDVRVVQRRDGVPADGGWVNGWLGCGAATPKRYLTATLTPDGVEQGLLVDDEPFDDALYVTQDLPEVFVVEVFATEGVYDWGIEIAFSSEQGDGTETIDSIQGYDLSLASGGDQTVYVEDLQPPYELVPDEESTQAAKELGFVC